MKKQVKTLVIAIAIILFLATTAFANVFGNKQTRVYHEPTCKVLVRVKLDNKVSFPTAEAAVKAGYKPCKRCHK